MLAALHGGLRFPRFFFVMVRSNSAIFFHSSHPSHRRTVAPSHLQLSDVGKTKNVNIKYKDQISYNLLIYNILYNIIIYNNIIYFYSIVSFSAISAPHVRIGLLLRCYGVTVLRMRKMFHGDWRFSRNRGAIQPQSCPDSMPIVSFDVSRGIPAHSSHA